MNIAIVGCRGIPGRYGGFETLAEQLSERLAARGHRVRVYCRTRYGVEGAQIARDVRRVTLPAIYTKHCETLSHTFLAILHQCFCRDRLVLVLNNANAIFIPLLRLFGKKVFVHVDGLEWQRDKWGRLAKAWHRLSERLAVWWAHELISDSVHIQGYYAKTYGRTPAYLAYGCDTGVPPDSSGLEKFGLKPRGYLLFVGRMEPENHPDLVLEAYARIDIARCNLPLVMVGWAPYAKKFFRQLRRSADVRVQFFGGIYGRDYRVLLHHCYAFLHASSVGGTHPVLVEAMGAGCTILASDIPENRETLLDAAVFFDHVSVDLTDKVCWILDNPEAGGRLGAMARERARQKFNWDEIAAGYEAVFKRFSGF